MGREGRLANEIAINKSEGKTISKRGLILKK